MRLLYGVLADFAAPGERGKLTLVGLFDSFIRPQEQMAAPLPRFFVAASIEASIADGTEHALEIRFLDDDGVDVIPRLQPPAMRFRARGPGVPLIGSLQIQIEGLRVAGFGTYEFDLVMDGKSVGTIPVYVLEAPPRPET